MAGASDYLENKLVDHMLGKASFTMPTTVYVALFTAAPTDAGGGTEVSGNAYARQAVTSVMASASSGQSTNGSDVLFPTATGSWGTVVAAGLFDASSGGNLLAWNTLTTSRAVGANDRVRFNAGTLVVTVD